MVVLLGKNGKLGVDSIKKLFSILLSIYAQVRQLIKKFSFAGVIELGLEIIKYKDDLKVFELAWDEIKDLKPEDGEVIEITKHLELEAIRLGLDNANILITVKEALEFISQVFELWEHGTQVYEKGVKFVDRLRSISVKEKIAA